jgi:hypothetical protein
MTVNKIGRALLVIGLIGFPFAYMHITYFIQARCRRVPMLRWKCLYRMATRRDPYMTAATESRSRGTSPATGHSCPMAASLS